MWRDSCMRAGAESKAGFYRGRDGFRALSSICAITTTMPDDNRISADLSAENKTTLLAALTTIRSLLPFLINLTPEDRMVMPKMGDKSMAFDEKVAGYMNTLPEFMPGFVSAAEVEKDRALRASLTDVVREVGTLASSLNDTLMVISSEIWMADLAYYQSLRLGVRRGIKGAKAAYDDLQVRFPGSRPKRDPGMQPAV